MACLGKRPVEGVEDVEFQEVVRQGVVENRVLGVEPLAIEDVAVAESLIQAAACVAAHGFSKLKCFSLAPPVK